MIQDAGAWGGWTSLLGHQLREFAVGNNGDGRIELFAIGGDGLLYHIWQTPPDDDWGQWTALGGSNLRHVAVAIDAGRALNVFALDTSGAVWTAAQDAPNGNWGKLQPLQGTNLKQLTAAVNGSQLVLCALGGDGIAYVRIRSAARIWAGWSSIPGAKFSQIALIPQSPVGLELFGLSTGHTAMVNNQPAGSGSWNGWSDLGGSGLKSVAPAPNSNTLLELLSIGGNSRARQGRHSVAPDARCASIIAWERAPSTVVVLQTRRMGKLASDLPR